VVELLENLSKADLITEVITRHNHILSLEERIAWFERQAFGKKSEKLQPLTPEDQATLPFEDLEVKKEQPSEKITVTYEKEKKKKNENHPGRHAIPAHIERVVIEIHPEGDLSGKEVIGKQVREVLEREPGKFLVKQYVKYIYKDKETGAISEGKLPSLPIEKGIPGPGLLAFILVNKFFYHLPLNRQLEIFKNEAAMILKASTLSGWVGQCCRLLLLLYDKLLEKVLSQSYLMVDETPIKVLMKQGDKKIILGYFWVYYSPELKMVFFDYRSGRAGEHPARRLKNFKGKIQSDGFIAYKNLPGEDIELLNCMAHARRKFVDARANNNAKADLALELMQKLYAVEKTAREDNYSNDQRFELRQRESVPVLNELKSWLDKHDDRGRGKKKNKITETTITPSQSIRTAINYTLNHWDGLYKYTTDGKLEIDNNPVERAIRPVAIGRRNYMFAGSEDGARCLAMMYSFYGTCKAQEIEPFAWTKTTLEKMPDYDPKRIEELLPIK
jgi:transposase